VVSEQVEQLATRARQLTAIGQLQAAREHWLAVLNLLATDAPERAGVLREVARLDERLNPKPKVNWTKRLGPLGILLAFLAKFKTVALVLLTKGKFLISILAFVGFYWALFGWWFAVGLGGSVLLHEMGHYVAVRRFGFRAELPMFIPGLGAYVKWNGANVDAGIRAQISLAGPLFGLFSGLLSYALFSSTHQAVWLAVAQFAGWLNLINLIPVAILDGGAAMAALGKQHRIAVLVVCITLGLLTREAAFFFVAIGTGYRLWKRDLPAEPRQGIAYAFVGLVIANGLLSWFCLNQARVLFQMGAASH
jgi:Zn-dependent protease